MAREVVGISGANSNFLFLRHDSFGVINFIGMFSIQNKRRSNSVQISNLSEAVYLNKVTSMCKYLWIEALVGH